MEPIQVLECLVESGRMNDAKPLNDETHGQKMYRCLDQVHLNAADRALAEASLPQAERIAELILRAARTLVQVVEALIVRPVKRALALIRR